MIRRALLRLLGAPSLPAALARIEQLTARVDELEMNKTALTLQADAQEHRADEAERLLDRETMINKRLGEELARARSTAGASWLVPRGQHDEDAAPRSINPVGERVLRAELASLRLDLSEARRGPCACSADARRSDADEVLR